MKLNIPKILEAMKKTKVNAIVCPSCGDTIYSRARHDFRFCSCKAVAIDGGFHYVKVCHLPETRPKFKALMVNASKKQLYDDWNLNRNKFGLIKNKKA